jgi:hypothetical protein
MRQVKALDLEKHRKGVDGPGISVFGKTDAELK